MKCLVVVDMQNDFITGALGTPEAQAIVPKVLDKINNWDGDVIIATQDTHNTDYLSTREGRYLPTQHCIIGTSGYNIQPDIRQAIECCCNKCYVSTLQKNTFGSMSLSEVVRRKAEFIQDIRRIEVVGVCTDICVISNVMLLKAQYPEADIIVDASCCAGTTPENHAAALQVMKMCQVDVVNE